MLSTSREKWTSKCFFIVSMFFPAWGKKKKKQVEDLFFLPLIFSRIPKLSNDWLPCGIGSKSVFSAFGSRGNGFLSQQVKSFQPLQTIIIPWDFKQFPIKRAMLFSPQVWLKTISLTRQNKVEPDFGCTTTRCWNVNGI